MLSAIFSLTVCLFQIHCSAVRGEEPTEMDVSLLDGLSENSSLHQSCFKISPDMISEAPWSSTREEFESLLNVLQDTKDCILEYVDLLISVCKHQEDIKISYTNVRNSYGCISYRARVVACRSSHPRTSVERENKILHADIEEELKSQFNSLKSSVHEYYEDVSKLLESEGAPVVNSGDPEHTYYPHYIAGEWIKMADFYGVKNLNRETNKECIKVLRRLIKYGRPVETNVIEMAKLVASIFNRVNYQMLIANGLRNSILILESFFTQLGNEYGRRYSAIRWNKYDKNTQDSMKVALWDAVYINGPMQYHTLSQIYMFALGSKKVLTEL